jgi:hypothetical protein
VLSERQIEYLLEQCERKTGKPLAKLRERLLRDRNPTSVIWELVIFDTLLSRFTAVEHEPGERMPDFLARASWLSRFSVEAACITSPSARNLAHSSDFDRWLYRAVVKAGVQTNGANIVVRPRDSGRAEIPEKHRWRAMTRHPSWATFIDELRGRAEGIWSCPEGGITVGFRVQQNGFINALPLAPAIPTDITKHPVYREIRNKARQIGNWRWRLKRRPVMLAILVAQSGPEFSEHAGFHDYSVRRAVFSALLDHNRMADLDRINILRQRLKFQPDGVYVESNRLRVAGSERISSVLIVRIRNDSAVGSHVPRSKAKAELYNNPHARNPFSESLNNDIQRLDFNRVEYGPGWESWQENARGSLKVRNLRRGGMLEFRSGKGGIEMRIPTLKIMAILAGEKTAKEVFAEYGNRPPNPLTFFRRVLASDLTLESVELVEADPTTRAEQQFSFRFGAGKAAVIARAKEPVDGQVPSGVDTSLGDSEH